MNATIVSGTPPSAIAIDLTDLPAGEITFALVRGMQDDRYEWQYPGNPPAPITVQDRRLVFEQFPGNTNTSYNVQVKIGNTMFAVMTGAAPAPTGIQVTAEQKAAFVEAAPRLRANALAAADEVDRVIGLMVVAPITNTEIELNALLNGAANMDDLRVIMEKLETK